MWAKQAAILFLAFSLIAPDLAQAVTFRLGRGCDIKLATLDKSRLSPRDSFDLAIQLNEKFPQVLAVALEKALKAHPDGTAAETWSSMAASIIAARTNSFEGLPLEQNQLELMKSFLIDASRDARITRQLVASTELMMAPAKDILLTPAQVPPPELLTTPERSMTPFDRFLSSRVGTVSTAVFGFSTFLGTYLNYHFFAGHAAGLDFATGIIGSALFVAMLAARQIWIPRLKMNGENRRRSLEYASAITGAQAARTQFNLNLKQALLERENIFEKDALFTVDGLAFALESPANSHVALNAVKDFESRLIFLGEDPGNLDGQVFDVVKAVDTLANHLNREANRFAGPSTAASFTRAAAQIEAQYAKLGVIYADTLVKEFGAVMPMLTEDLTQKIARLSSLESAVQDLKLVLSDTYQKNFGDSADEAFSQDRAAALTTMKSMADALGRAEVILHGIKINTRSIDETLIDLSRIAGAPQAIGEFASTNIHQTLTAETSRNLVAQLKSLKASALTAGDTL